MRIRDEPFKFQIPFLFLVRSQGNYHENSFNEWIFVQPTSKNCPPLQLSYTSHGSGPGDMWTAPLQVSHSWRDSCPLCRPTLATSPLNFHLTALSPCGPGGTTSSFIPLSLFPFSSHLISPVVRGSAPPITIQQQQQLAMETSEKPRNWMDNVFLKVSSFWLKMPSICRWENIPWRKIFHQETFRA